MPFRNTQQALQLEIDPEVVSRLPILEYNHSIHIIKSLKEAEKAIKLLQKEPILGFDTESRPAFKKGENYPISIVQLATEKAAYIFQISLIGSLQPLEPILYSHETLKIGIAIRDDLQRLYDLSPINLNGFVELTHLSTQLGIKQTGLRNLVAILLEKRICKRAQRSNWSNAFLTRKQLIYAAIDAWACREIYLNLLTRLQHHSLTPSHKKITFPFTKRSSKQQLKPTVTTPEYPGSDFAIS